MPNPVREVRLPAPVPVTFPLTGLIGLAYERGMRMVVDEQGDLIGFSGSRETVDAIMAEEGCKSP